MLKKYILVCKALLFCGVSFAQLVQINDNLTEQALIQDVLISGCASATNVTSPHNGSVDGLRSFGYFQRGDSDFPFEDGIVLSTGNVMSGGNVFNGATLNEGTEAWGTDVDLETTLGTFDTFNATTISFNFVSISSGISFNYILASEEYFADFPCFYADAFAFLIRPAGSGLPFVNIANIPNTNIPVNTNNIRPEIVGFCPAANEDYFFGYDVGDTNYNGRTTVLTASATITPNVEYEIKLIIADQNDTNYDSAVFIQGNSFTSSVSLGADFSTCAESVEIDANVNNSFASYQWYFNDALLIGENNTILTVNQTGNYRVEVEIPLDGTICNLEDDINITLSNVQSANPVADFELCNVNLNGVQAFDLSLMDAQIQASVPPANYDISYHTSQADAQANANAINGLYNNTSNPQTIYTRIVDSDTGCLAYNSFNLIVNPLPQINTPSPLVLCDGGTGGSNGIDLTVKNNEISTNTNLSISYHLNQADAQNGINAITMPYTNSNSNEVIYVRVLNSSTGCATITNFELTVLPTPNINLSPIFIDACDTDLDGVANFNLNEVTDEVLQGLTGVTLTFHESLEDATNGTNAIVNTANYQNNQNNVQVIYIRVVDDTSGCAAVRSFQIHTNLLLTGTEINNVNACDEDGNGTESFNLLDIAEDIINDLPDVTVTFYLSAADRANQSNALNINQNFSTSNPQTTIYLEITSPTCSEYAQIQFTINPVTEFDSVGVIDICDTNQDGFIAVNLTSRYNNQVTFGQGGFNVSYFLTENDANNNQNVLPNIYTNTTNPYTLFTRITNSNTGCAFVNSFQVNVILPPESSPPSDLFICDTDQDGIAFVDLTAVVNELVSDPTDLLFSFHLTNNNAIANAGSLSNPENYETSSRLIYVRTTSPVTGCGSVQTFNVVVSTPPVFPDISDMIVCTNNLTGIEDFIFESKDAEILNGQPGKRVLYFETLADAENRSNPIDKTTAYQNTSSTQTIYVRVENEDNINCFGTASFDIEVGILPQFNEPTDLSICDDIDNTGTQTFDLTPVIDEISQGISENQTISFHQNLTDAENNDNPIPLQFTNNVNPQPIFVRITNDTSFCVSITSFTLRVIQIVNQLDESPTVFVCDDDYDGITQTNLIEEVQDLLDIRQENISLSFFESLADLENNMNEIPNPENYSNNSNPQNLYFQITNNISGCSLDIAIQLAINLPPVINEIDLFEICDNDLNVFNLNTINSALVNNTTGINITYFSSLANAENNTNSLSATNYNYQSANDTLFARIAFTATGCFVIHQFNLLVNPQPLAIQPNDFEACDDSSEDGFALFNLGSLSAGILGGQSNADFSLSYHSSIDDAATGDNLLPLNYNGEHGQTIYVRVENNNTGCFNITQFNLIVNEFPNAPETLVVCDDDYDGLNNFDLTQVAPGLFDTPNPNIVISYFTSVADLEADFNAISTPAAFENSSNPQTVYVKTFNTVANCFNYVSLELEVNLPPAINNIDVFDVCVNPENQANLEDFNSLLLAETTNVVVNYYATAQDAIDQINALAATYNYTGDSTNLFARVEFTTTSCFFIQPFTLVVNPLPIANQPSDFEACDDSSGDGFALFDLASQNADVLGGQSSADFSVSYHSAVEAASTGANPLPDSYNGENGQIIYVRVENNSTGCFNLTQFSLIVNEFPNTPATLELCDDDYDGLNTFDLTQVSPGLFDTPNPNIVISYFTSVADLEADVNAIATPNAFQNTSNPQIVYVKTFNTIANCFNFVNLELEVNLPPAINNIDVFDVCSNNNNEANLEDFNSLLLAETNNVIVTYYATAQNAIDQTNALASDYNYTSDATNLFVRVEFTTTGCFFIQPFTLLVNPLPIANQPNDMEACDDSSSDGFAIFNLESQSADILGGQSSADFSVSYHSSMEQAIADSNVLPQNYNGENGQTIYARVENNSTGCFSFTQFNLIVNEFPNTPDTLVVCDDDYDGLNSFDLTQVEPNLFNTPNPNIVISYFTSVSDLEADVNAIATPAAFENSSNPQTVYVKTFNTVANCFNYVSLELEVNLPPAINNIDVFELCFNNENLANLEDFNSLLLAETNNVLVSYYASAQDAIDQTNTLATNYNYTADTTNLFARVAFSTTGCFFIQPFTLVVNPLPIANQPNDLEACDDDFDGLLLFDLSVQTNAILGAQSPDDFTVTYHETLEDAQMGTNILNSNHTGADMDNIYIRVENNALGCFNTTAFSLIVNPRPVVDLTDQVFCPEEGPLQVSADTGNPDDSYLWFNGSTNSEITISEPGDYSVLVTSIFGCETEVNFNVSESESPVIESIIVTNFSDPNSITVNVSGSGDYYFLLDGQAPQTSNVFENVTLGFHTVTVIDLNGCDEASQEVVVIDAPKFMTPNNDGYFDTWHISGVETLPGTTVNIFDRYGKLLAVLDSSSRGWDGNYRGKAMPTNDYWYVANVVQGDASFEVKGHFTLKR